MSSCFKFGHVNHKTDYDDVAKKDYIKLIIFRLSFLTCVQKKILYQANKIVKSKAYFEIITT